ncbi:3-oxo-5-alpha-steroid 4-dehydrogenase [Xylona heveae TC161]|uniref:3-oxo-5-alpha-steroid 4-dehydrogenase n=1 Tax=Xylona heveae (strain CBS 132557 / TC161) TaxID=1328760 RepID=A0A165J666_XYLHT|nr:3-oxo-5-alpha-steroid 4-dehydrogenase [Xylona heveae TC161]KZF25786.1 3-oxo-5-alpha-steroid 4-dehydrogenase [Xylona heveae TC161]
MPVLENWLPPSRENWELVSYLWRFFPLVTTIQWLVDFYPQGKTSITSSLNIPGKIAWATMEAPGFMILVYIVYTLPARLGMGVTSLPLANWIMVLLFVIHYIYRALLAPLVFNPTMSPIHVLVWAAALVFQICNALSIGGWLGGYGPVSDADWTAMRYGYWMPLGLVVWAVGFAGNVFHDEHLRQIRRGASGAVKNERSEFDKAGGQRESDGRNGSQTTTEDKPEEKVQGESQRTEELETSVKNEKNEKNERSEKRKKVDKVYVMPHSGLFRVILYPHYLCEWIEWTGYWMMTGFTCVPARSFLLNEISTMFPRALQGKRWYVERFGREKVGARRAVIPGVV